MLPFETKEVILKVEGVHKSYGVPILRDVNFEIHNLVRPDVKQGQIVSLVGKSGCGKSTLFRILAGLEKPNSGTVKVLDSWDGVDNYWDVKEGDMGVVFQNSYVYPWRKVWTLLRMAAGRNTDIKGSEKDEYIMEIVNTLHLGDHLDKYANQLSGGQRQRVAIAEQVLGGSRFILLDEPLSGLDILVLDKVAKTLSDLVLTDEYKTIVVVSHDLVNSLAISDTAFVMGMEEGKEGATITHKICLATQGLAWKPDIKENPLFRDLLKHVKSLL